MTLLSDRRRRRLFHRVGERSYRARTDVTPAARLKLDADRHRGVRVLPPIIRPAGWGDARGCQTALADVEGVDARLHEQRLLAERHAQASTERPAAIDSPAAARRSVRA